MLLSGEDNADQLVWEPSSDGNFTIKSALTLIQNDAQASRDPIWKLVGDSKVPQRIRFFLWLVTHDRIMSNMNRFSHGLARTPFCGRCPNTKKSTLHLLRDCPSARDIWRQLVLRIKLTTFFTSPLHQWIRSNLATSDTNPKWPTTFAVTFWWIWKWRNKMCFEGNSDNPPDPPNFIRRKVEVIWLTLQDRKSVV